MEDKHQISYFPYLFLRNIEKIEFDGMAVWNFERQKSIYISNAKLRKHISALLKSNRFNNKPIYGIGVITLKGNSNFQWLSPRDKEKVDELRKILFLCSTAKLNIHQDRNVGEYLILQ